MKLKQAIKICGEMDKNLGGDHQAALRTLVRYLEHVAGQTRLDKYRPGGFGSPVMFKDIQDCFPGPRWGGW